MRASSLLRCDVAPKKGQQIFNYLWIFSSLWDDDDELMAKAEPSLYSITCDGFCVRDFSRLDEQKNQRTERAIRDGLLIQEGRFMVRLVFDAG